MGKTSTRNKKSQRPLFTIDGPIKARVYRGTFHPFEITKFVDRKKLAAARGVPLEVGTVAAAGVSATLIARIRKGVVTGLALERCAGCRKGAGIRGAQLAKLLPELKTRLELAMKKLPAQRAPRARSRAMGFMIPIWPWPPIIVITGDPDPDGNACIGVIVAGKICIYCTNIPAKCH